MKEFLDEFGGASVLLIVFSIIIFSFAEIFHLCKAGIFLTW